MVTTMQRLRALSMMAAVSSEGKFLFTINSGKNNGQTFILFLIKLSEHLDAADGKWRAKTVIMVDNAPYHRSKMVMEKYEQLKIPIMFMGPYQFKLAPVELMFCYIKNRDLNPLNTRALGR
jgi:transposase